MTEREVSSDRKNNMVASKSSRWHPDLLAGNTCLKVSGGKVLSLVQVNPFACLRVEYHLGLLSSHPRIPLECLYYCCFLPHLSPLPLQDWSYFLPSTKFSVGFGSSSRHYFPFQYCFQLMWRKELRANRKLYNPSMVMQEIGPTPAVRTQLNLNISTRLQGTLMTTRCPSSCNNNSCYKAVLPCFQTLAWNRLLRSEGCIIARHQISHKLRIAPKLFKMLEKNAYTKQINQRNQIHTLQFWDN